MILRRILTFAAGAFLLAVVVWLGLASSNDPTFVIWFGLSSALFAPTGLAMVTYAITGGQREVLRRLSKVPEIEKLISEAKTQEEKILLLEQERARLLEAVQLETRRQTLIAKKANLEQDGVRILAELQAVAEELSYLELDIESSTVREEIDRLNERLKARQRRDFTIRVGDVQFSIGRDWISNFPLAFFLAPRPVIEAMLTLTELTSKFMIESVRLLNNSIANIMNKIFRR